MQPLYEDQYEILRLVSGQPLHISAQSLYPLKKIEAKHLFGWMLLKKAYLFLKNAFKGYPRLPEKCSNVVQVSRAGVFFKIKSQL